MRLMDRGDGRRLAKRLYRAAARKGISYEQVKIHLRERWGYTSSGELTLGQYREVRKMIHKLSTLPKRDRVQNEKPSEYTRRWERERGGTDAMV